MTIGYVCQRRFVFHKSSVDGSAKADAALTGSPADRVCGVVYQLSREQKRLLDQYEFLGVGYDEEVVEVIQEDGVVRAWMYVARRDAIDASLLQYTWYHDLIIAGACQHGLPQSYVDHLQSFDAVVDPNVERHALNQRLIEAYRKRVGPN